MRYPMLRTYFLTGLLVLVPVMITITVLGAVVGFFSHTIIGQAFDTWANRVLFRRAEGDTLIPGFGLAATIGIILLVGMIASTVIGSRLFIAIEQLLMKTPVVNIIYPPAKQIIDFLVAPKGKGFRKVVLVEFPRQGAYSIGFITGEAPYAPTSSELDKYVTIFVPFAPAPMSGALMVVKEDDVIPLEMTVEEAFSFIVSAGVFTRDKNEEAKLPVILKEAVTGEK